MNNLGFLLGEWVLGKKKIKTYLTLSGDLHHYRRHEHITDPTQQKIVAGGGGAFLHPTHFNRGIDEVNVYGQIFKLKKDTQFPKPSTCFWLTFLNLFFPLLNPWFGILTAPAYLLFGWHFLHVEWNIKFLATLLASQPTLVLGLILAAYAGFFYFSQGGRIFRLLWGALAHGTAHVVAVWWLADELNHYFGTNIAYWRTATYRLVGLLAGGYVLGSFIMGIYLLLSLNLLRHHQNEAFSALRIKNFKNFLRIRIRADGALEIFPIGVPHLNKPPILIEGPITIVPA
jgi:hypothetical protein